MYYRARFTSTDLVNQLHLARRVVDELLTQMQEESLVEVLGRQSALLPVLSLTERGRSLAEQARQRNGYLGPAPVPIEQYVQVQSRQSVRGLRVTPDDVSRALSELVQPAAVTEAIGAAVVSGAAMLLYGPSGNGKSTISALIQQMLPGVIAVPYALDIDGQTVSLFDPRVHTRVAARSGSDGQGSGGPAEASASPAGLDRRFALCHRPLVTLGSELTLDHLELRYSPSERAYVAPPQVKANGGVLVVDDLGRQRARPEEVLNRWIGPMGVGTDHLVLQTGGSARVPFDLLLVFATNLDARELGDEAFERRIRHKILVPNPTRQELFEIIRRECAAQGIAYNEAAAKLLVRALSDTDGRVARGSHPGDILRNLSDFARYNGIEPELTAAGVRAAVDAFFVTAAD